MSQRFKILFITFLFFASSTHALERFEDIANRKQQLCEAENMVEATSCMSEELRESDERLNEIYSILTQALAKPQALRSAQRAWISFRNAHCAFDTADSLSGSAASYTVDLCLLRLTEHRITALEATTPCNGCVLFKDQYYGKSFTWPKRKRINSLPPIEATVCPSPP